MVGSIVPAGTINPRWMFVTKVDGGTVYGRMWSARTRRWTKRACATGYARESLFKRTPRCPQPARPRD